MRKKTLGHAEFNVDVHVVVTELGIVKTHDFMMDMEEIDSVIDRISSQT